jgi:hypothetical protein
MLGGLRERALAALSAFDGPGDSYAASYTVNGSSVTADTGNASLWAQAQAVEAWSASRAVTGLESDAASVLRAFHGLEADLFRNGSFAATMPEPSASTYSGAAVAALVGALRDMALTGEEPLSVYRFVDAFDTLVDAPPLALSASQAPPIVGASFAYNASNGTAAPATGFDAFGALLASFEFATTGARFNLDVGGGVSVTEDSALRLHNANAAGLGAAFDALDQQIADLEAQLAALQASFDAINSTASDIEERLNLSLMNETVSAARIQGMIDNVTALRAQLNQSQGTAANATALYANISASLNETRLEVANLTLQLAEAHNATSKALGDLNQTRQDLTDAQESEARMAGQLDERTRERDGAQAGAALAAVFGVLGGFGLFYFVNRFVLSQPLGSAPAGKGDSSKGKDEDEEDD